ncbi:MAG: hypothetical protein ACE5DK_04950 [Paracoccaceae bacterium]
MGEPVIKACRSSLAFVAQVFGCGLKPVKKPWPANLKIGNIGWLLSHNSRQSQSGSHSDIEYQRGSALWFGHDEIQNVHMCDCSDAGDGGTCLCGLFRRLQGQEIAAAETALRCRSGPREILWPSEENPKKRCETD